MLLTLMEEITQKMQNDLLNKVIELQYCVPFCQTHFLRFRKTTNLNWIIRAKTNSSPALSQVSDSCLSQLVFLDTFPI